MDNNTRQTLRDYFEWVFQYATIQISKDLT